MFIARTVAGLPKRSRMFPMFALKLARASHSRALEHGASCNFAGVSDMPGSQAEQFLFRQRYVFAEAECPLSTQTALDYRASA